MQTVGARVGSKEIKTAAFELREIYLLEKKHMQNFDACMELEFFVRKIQTGSIKKFFLKCQSYSNSFTFLICISYNQRQP